MAFTTPALCSALSKSLPAWSRFCESAARVGASPPDLLAGHAFGRTQTEVLEGKGTRGFAFGATTLGFPQSVLIRGDAAAVLIVLRAQEDPSTEYGVFVRQPRIAIGRTDYLELVAGMLDRTSSIDRINIADAIRKEVEEETGQHFAPEEFVNLTQFQRLHAKGRPCYRPSDELTEGSPTTPGGCDESIHFFCVVKTLPLATILGLRGVQAGNAAEHEHTLVQIIPMTDALFVCTDVKFLSALALFQAWRKSATVSPVKRLAATPGLASMGLYSSKAAGAFRDE
jgi:8-oxo-dGTP pyrophosphatase MutT (NUDIX family)